VRLTSAPVKIKELTGEAEMMESYSENLFSLALWVVGLFCNNSDNSIVTSFFPSHIKLFCEGTIVLHLA
jgi:hypothetical protein